MLNAHKFYAKENEEYRLQTVQILFRHGIRTPITKIPFMDFKAKESIMKHTEIGYIIPEWHNGVHTIMAIPFQGQKMTFFQKIYENDRQHIKGTCASGMLTRKGEQQLFEIGVSMRKRYIEQLEFISSNFDPSQVYIRSTDIDRTQQSAMSLLMGMFPHEKRKDQVIQIHTRESKMETMYAMTRNCKRLRHLIRSTKESPEYKGFLEMFGNEMKSYPHLEHQVNNPENWHNTIQMHLLNDMPIPNYITPKLVEKFEEFANKEQVLMHTKEISRLSIGQFLHEIGQNFARSVHQGKHLPKLFLYSGHDSSIIPLLSALDIYDGKFPPVATQVIFELYSGKGNEKWLRIHYRNKDLKIPNVTYKNILNGVQVCNYKDFEQILSQVALSETDYERDCQMDN